MNKREFLSAVGAGFTGLLFPRKTEGVPISDKPVLEGLTDKEMAEKIAQYPQGPLAGIDINFSDSNSIGFRHQYFLPSRKASWEVVGTYIWITHHDHVWASCSSGIDIKFLKEIAFLRKDSDLAFIIYRKFNGGWFTICDPDV